MNKLNYKRLGEEEGMPLVILHGLFGMLDNWMTLGRKYAENGYDVWLVDQRNHGKSFHSDDFNYYLLAEDLYDFFNLHDIDSAIIMGHSMGGKTAMQFAVNYPERVYKLAVIDIAPIDYEGNHQSIFEGVFKTDLSQAESRSDVETQLTEYIAEKSVRQFIMKNLKRAPSNKKFVWKANFHSLQQNYEDVLMNSLSPYDSFDGLSLFVNGGKSDKYMSEDKYEIIYDKFPNANIELIKEAGHWIHAEKPDELLRITLEFFE